MLRVIKGATFKYQGISPVFHMINYKLAWFFNMRGILLHTRMAKLAKERGVWMEIKL